MPAPEILLEDLHGVLTQLLTISPHISRRPEHVAALRRAHGVLFTLAQDQEAQSTEAAGSAMSKMQAPSAGATGAEKGATTDAARSRRARESGRSQGRLPCRKGCKRAPRRACVHVRFVIVY